MDVKLVLLVVVALAMVLNRPVAADFFYNHAVPKLSEISGNSRYKCVPGRTIINVVEKPTEVLLPVASDSEEYRRSMPLRSGKEEGCYLCVCSASGKDEFCFHRPADSVNECVLTANAMQEINSGMPFEHTKSLSYRIRRDYLWHNDEIPYTYNAKCFRGHSYYSNSVKANSTDIDVGSEVDSLLDYANDNTCYYCICSVSGNAVGCLPRNVQYCNYFRVMRSDKAQRDRYTALLEQDRPTYFRQLSWRLRRTMDDGIYQFLDNVAGDGLPTSDKCVPFVSEYTNCNEENICTGCTKCSCTNEGEWSCEDVSECGVDPDPEESILDAQDEIFDDALKQLQMDMQRKNEIGMNKPSLTNKRVPTPADTKRENELLGDIFREYKMSEIVERLRSKRSTNMSNNHSKRSVNKTNNKHNNTTHFYHTVDELNEDTLKRSNLSGTLLAQKMDMKPQLNVLRRSSDVGNGNKSLQIEFNPARTLHQINDNKIDVADHEIKLDASHEHLKAFLGNHTQILKDKELSKIIVNELKNGSEVIGDSSAPVTSNITFTPENDTLTAMAFIAGNLLNKLWNMEKDMSGSSAETDLIKQEKITGLIDLFKEPLNLRQETFLRNALEKLSIAIDKDKDVKNISICDNVQEVRRALFNTSNLSEEIKSNESKTKEERKKIATVNAIAKINNVLELINKFESVQGNLSELKHGPKLKFSPSIPYSKKLVMDTVLTKEDKTSLNMFGNLIEKITRLLMPGRNNKKMVSQIKSQSVLTESNNIVKNKLMDLFNIDISNTTVTAKDKLTLDYLTHIDQSPDCLLNKNNFKASDSLPKVEGNILLNLSEFFKMKSFSDLIKILDKENSLRTTLGTTTQVVETTTIAVKKIISSNVKDVDSNRFESTKEKLKKHLKTILEDLIELQNAKGISVKGDLKVADALPCIYNILNAGSGVEMVKKSDETLDLSKKMENVFSNLKNEIKAAKTRRSNGGIVDKRPKAAVVWDRVIKNLNKKPNSVTRRSLGGKTPKSYAEIYKMMNEFDNNSETYKNYALLGETPAASKLMLLQALEQDVKNSMTVLEEIKLALGELSKLPSDKFKELQEFVGNVVTSMSLNKKVNDKIKSAPRKFFVNERNYSNKMSKPKSNKKPMLRYNGEEGKDMKVSRVQVLNQLIRNRMQLYITMKEDKGFDPKNDMNYNIAKRVLYYLDAKNYDLAKELFKMFMMQKHDNLGLTTVNDKYVSTSSPQVSLSPMRRMEKEALIQFNGPNKLSKQINWVNQDHLIKQLINIKNMGV